MALSEKFCLRWNDFESNISDAFKDLREQKDFFDVTLACDDSQIEAHKVILSACSPFFRNILRRNPHQHPLLYIKGVKYKELVAVLNFMYMGEVNVVQEELNSFLVVAEELRVKGLTQNNSPNEPSHKPNNSQEHHRPIDRPRAPPEKAKVFSPIRPKPAPTSQASVPLIKPIANSFVPNDDDDIQEVAPVKSEPQEEPPQPALQNFVEIPHPEPQVDFQSQAEDMERNTIAVDESFVVDESYNYEQYYDDGSELMNQGAGTPMGATDANKGPCVQNTKKRAVPDTIDVSQTKQKTRTRSILPSTKESLNPSIQNQEEPVKKVKEKPLLERYSSVWKCGICDKIGSTKRIIVSHLREAHNVTKKL